MNEYLIIIFLLAFAPAIGMAVFEKASLYPKIEKYISERESEFGEIPDERKVKLLEISEYVKKINNSGSPAKIIFICTHNSRRSHMAQLWAQAMSVHYGAMIESYSGGTMASKFNPRAVAAMKGAGFKFITTNFTDNPVYKASFSESEPETDTFSKVYSDEINPAKEFIAVMVCSNADEACPLVPGADARFAIPYEDPKKFDGTDKEAEKYAERSAQIAREMAFVFANAR